MSQRPVRQDLQLGPALHSFAAVGAALITVAALVLGGCAAEPATIPSPPEDVQFSGAVMGRLTSGDAAIQPITSNPTPPITEDNQGRFVQAAPTATQCSTFPISNSGLSDDYVAVVVGSAGASRVALTIEISTDQAAYTAPGTPLQPGSQNNGGSVQLSSADGVRSWQQVIGPNGVELSPDPEI